MGNQDICIWCEQSPCVNLSRLNETCVEIYGTPEQNSTDYRRVPPGGYPVTKLAPADPAELAADTFALIDRSTDPEVTF